MADVLKLHLPTILKSGDAKKEWKRVMSDAAEHGKTYVVTGTANKAVILMGLKQFEELRDSYLALAEELEARKALEKEGTKEALERASREELPRDKDEFVTASKVDLSHLAGY